MSHREPTLKDVAAIAGVSIKTASRVLNDDPKVAPATRAIVSDAMRALDYRPDPAARSLRAGRDLTVGVVVETIGDVFVSGLVASVEEVLSSEGYQVLIASSHRDAGRERAIVHDFVQRRCAGVIVMPSANDALEGLRIGDLPVVFVDRIGNLAGSQSVVVDDFALAKAATDHLVARGHRRIALLSDDIGVATTRDRHRGFRAAMEVAGIDVDEALVRADCPDESRVLGAIEALFSLTEPPTAIISTNTRLSLGVVPALHLVGRTDTAFVAFGDFPMASSLEPAVTVIDHSPQRVGEAAARTLLGRLRPTDAQDGPPDVVVVPAGLIPRGSGELAPATRTTRDDAARRPSTPQQERHTDEGVEMTTGDTIEIGADR